MRRSRCFQGGGIIPDGGRFLKGYPHGKWITLDFSCVDQVYQSVEFQYLTDNA